MNDSTLLGCALKLCAQLDVIKKKEEGRRARCIVYSLDIYIYNIFVL